MREKIIIEILSKCINFLDTNQCNQLRLALENELHKYQFQLETTDLVTTNNFQSKLLLYLASKKVEGLSDKTLKEYKLTLSNFALQIRKDFDKVDEMDIRLYIAQCMQRGLKNSTINNMVNQIKTFYGWMHDNEYIKRNPSKLIKNVKFDKFVRKALTEDEFEKLKYACKTERDIALVTVIFSTAGRVSEIAKLNKSDINWHDDSLYVFGKGKRERQVFLNSSAKLYLTKYLEKRTDKNSALFVTSKSPHNRLSTRAIEEIFHNLGKRAGISTDVCPHKLRHQAAIKLTRSNVPITVIQKYLGHSSVATTEIYSRVCQDDVRTNIKKHLN